jgi:uncharacterized membrane protein
MKFLRLFFVVSMFAVGLYLFPELPSSMPIHWNIRGEIDNYASREFAVWMFPVLAIGMFALFEIAPSFDPKKEKYKLFAHEWDIMKTGILGFFAYIHFVTLYVSLHQNTNIMPLMFMGFGSLFILMGNYMSKIRQNYFIGIKVPWTLADEDNWNKTHRFASWCFVGAGILTLAEAYFIWFAPVIIFGSIFLAAGLPIIYSFLLYKHAEDNMKFVYILLALIILSVAGLRFISGEDDWMCQNGTWVAHGQPSSHMPEEPCFK